MRWAAIDAVAWLAQGGTGATVARAFEMISVRLEDVDWPVRMAAAIGLRNLLHFLSAMSEEMRTDDLEAHDVGSIEDVKNQLGLVLHPLLKLLRDPAKEMKLAALELLALLCEQTRSASFSSQLRNQLQHLSQDPDLARAVQAAHEAIERSFRLESQKVPESSKSM